MLPDEPAIEELLDQGYTVDRFGCEGLLTRNPKILIYLQEDHRFVPFGADRFHPAHDMVEWLVMQRCGISANDVRHFCELMDPYVVVIARQQIEVDIPGEGPLVVEPGSRLEISYKQGLIAAVNAAGVVIYDSARGDSPWGGDRRP